jgi:hypothetical protein
VELGYESEKVIYAKLRIENIICIIIFKNHEKRWTIFEKVGDKNYAKKKRRAS